MGLNTGVVTGRNGILRVMTIILGVISFGLAADVYVKVFKEQFFLGVAVTLFIVSVIWLVLSLVDVIKSSESSKKLDAGFHLIGGIVLIVAVILWIISVVDYGDAMCPLHEIRNLGNTFATGKITCNTTTSWYIKRILVGVFGIINSLLYIILGALVAKG